MVTSEVFETVCVFKTSFPVALEQGCQTQFLEGHSPAEFSSNPN